jgi:hypothetical protein
MYKITTSAPRSSQHSLCNSWKSLFLWKIKEQTVKNCCLPSVLILSQLSHIDSISIYFHEFHTNIIRLPDDLFPLFYSQSLWFTHSFPQMTPLKSLKLIKAERYYIKLCYFQTFSFPIWIPYCLNFHLLQTHVKSIFLFSYPCCTNIFWQK